MPEQILTILERHARRAEPTAEGMFKIVDANTPEPNWCELAVRFRTGIRCALPSRLPGRVVHLGHRLRLTSFLLHPYEYVDRIQSANALHD